MNPKYSNIFWHQGVKIFEETVLKSKQDQIKVAHLENDVTKARNPACHCAKGTGHPQTLFLFKDDEGQRRCKLIRRADEKRLLRAGALYRQFRKDLRQLTTINKREKQSLMALVKARTIHYT